MKLLFRLCSILSSTSRVLLLMLLAVSSMAGTSFGESTAREQISLHTNGNPVSEDRQNGSIEIIAFTVETQDAYAIIHSGLKLDNANGIKAQLRDGAVMALTCKVQLERVRTLLSNVLISETKQIYYLRHDPLTREFVLNSSSLPSVRKKDFAALLESLGQLHFILPLEEPLVAGETYRIRFDLTLQHAEVPPWLSQALFFWSWDVVSPVSVTQEFIF